MSPRRHLRPAPLGALAGVAAAMASGGCNVDSFFNPSVTGYWEHTPTTIPILERIDVIEPVDDSWGQTTSPEPADLIPTDLTYRVVPGDVVTISIFELLETGSWSVVSRRIDAGGYLRVPELGDVPGAGKTAQEIEDTLAEILRKGFIDRPQVDVVVESASAFTYTLYGAIPGPGQYSIINADLRLLDALASAGGLSPVIKNVYVIRQVALSEEALPAYRRSPGSEEGGPATSEPVHEPVDIDELIRKLEQGADGPSPGMLQNDPPAQDEPPIDIDDLLGPQPAQDPAPGPDRGRDPGADQAPTPPRTPPPPGRRPEVDVDDLRIPRVGSEDPGTWMYIEERGEWVRVPRTGAEQGRRPAPPRAVDASGAPVGAPAGAEEPPLFVERVIKIPAARLTHGDARYNVVVRPKDRIFVEPPPSGVVYIDGEIIRSGTFNLPTTGITLSRLVAAAGGLGQLAIPERVDLVRIVGENQEAVIRLNLGAIRHRTEPDVLLKPDDHIIIGTNWIATPLAIMRSGFRSTYGFGFLLDRNFGNDVFGAPPTNELGQ